MKSYTANFVWLNMGDLNFEGIFFYYTKQLSCWCSVVEVEVVVVLQTDTVDRALLPPCLPAPRTAVETHPQHLLRLSICRGSRVRPAKGRGRNWHQSFQEKGSGKLEFELLEFSPDCVLGWRLFFVFEIIHKY